MRDASVIKIRGDLKETAFIAEQNRSEITIGHTVSFIYIYIDVNDECMKFLKFIK